MKRTVAVALSGGLDSSVAAALLKKEDYRVIGLHFQTGYESTPDNLDSSVSNDCATQAQQVANEIGNEFKPRAQNATPGSADLCLITETELEQAMAYVQACSVEIIEGPVVRTGATGKLLSFYIRDPDLNLIEISNPA